MKTDRPLRFCMVTTFYPPFHFGGDAIQVRRLCQALARRGHAVHVIHCADAYLLAGQAPTTDFEQEANITVHTLRSRFGPLSPLITQQTGSPGLKGPAIRAILERGNFDVIHYHNMSLIGPQAMVWGRAVKLYTLHEHWLVCPMHILWRYDREVCTRRTCLTCQIKGGVPPQLWRHSRLLTKSLRHVDRFIAPSRFVAEEHARQGLPLSAEIIPHFVPLPALFKTLSGGVTSRPYFLFAGRIEVFKGIEFLIETFKRFMAADLWIAGEGRDLARMRELATDHPHIRFLGKLQPEQLAQRFRGARGLIVPSLCYETFGLSAVEALAHGTPVIVHKLGGLAELARECRAIAEYEGEDELVRALTDLLKMDESTRNDLALAGRDSVDRCWSEESHVAAYLDLIKRCKAERQTAVEIGTGS